MLYKFNSRASPPFVMLEVHARQLFDIIGKAPERKGIVTLAADAGCHRGARSGHGARAPQSPTTTTTMPSRATTTRPRSSTWALRQRAAPLLHMLRDSLADGKDVTWEV